jgi:hypothetical protein
MGLKPLEIYIKNSHGVFSAALAFSLLLPDLCHYAWYLTAFANPLHSTGHKRAYCYGPEDLVDQVKKDMCSTKFVKTKDIVLTSAKGEVMQLGKPLSDYGVTKGDVLTSQP